jgi:hypothetical protein
LTAEKRSPTTPLQALLKTIAQLPPESVAQPTYAYSISYVETGQNNRSSIGSGWGEGKFVWWNGPWERQQGNKLVGTGASGAAQQGSSVSRSSDGSTAIVRAASSAGSIVMPIH